MTPALDIGKERKQTVKIIQNRVAVYWFWEPLPTQKKEGPSLDEVLRDWGGWVRSSYVGLPCTVVPHAHVAEVAGVSSDILVEEVNSWPQRL
jgi:hypothetical protein